MKAAFVVDSTSGLREELLNRPDVYMFNLTITFDNNDSYKDTVDEEEASRFYDQLEDSKTLPKTAQATPEEYIEIFDDIVEKGYDTVFIITLAKEISGTFQTVTALAQGEYGDKFDVYAIDSKGTSFIIEGILEQGLELVKQNKSAQEIEDDLNWLAEESRIYFMLDNLHNLAKGGRIGSASALLGNVLRIRPILYFQDDGSVGEFERLRTNKRVFKRWLEIVDEAAEAYPAGLKIYFAHGHAQDKLDFVYNYISKQHPELEYRIGFLTPVLGTHGGKGSLGMGLMPSIKNRK